MEIHSLNDGIPVIIVNRNLLLHKRGSHYNGYEHKDKTSHKNNKNGKNNCKKINRPTSPSPKQKNSPSRCYKKKNRSKKKKNSKDKKAKKKSKAKKKPPKAKKKPPPNNDKNGGKNGDNNNNNNNNNKEVNNPSKSIEPAGPTRPTGSPESPELTIFPTSPYKVTQTSAADMGKIATPTVMSNAALPSEEDGRQKLSIAGISVITIILVGIVVLVGLAVYRKRYNLRRGAVRLYDDPELNDALAEPRFSSMSGMRSLRIPSMPPKVQLTRLSSATILLPFRDNNPVPLNNKYSDNNGYLSPYTRVHDLSGPSGINNQKTDSMLSHPSSHESYTSLESSFPIPPQRIAGDSYNTTPTSATFGDIYNLKKNNVIY
ncbi:hypothetical protein C1645_761023 [Glomus cerebriforme]|uniref:Uncharacterized protein n=1 Tax=Glomus cerebriforme TaxID=658196 RepID=A0A397TGD7_9GLOM|nr:hypothetical protein C1645_761023 [Glomus cerebriforme]